MYTVWLLEKKSLFQVEDFKTTYDIARGLQDEFRVTQYICYDIKNKKYIILHTEELGKDRKNIEYRLWTLVAILL